MRIANELLIKSQLLGFAKDLSDERRDWFVSRLYDLYRKDEDKTRKFADVDVLAGHAKGYDRSDLESGTVGFIDLQGDDGWNWNRQITHIADWLADVPELNLHDLRGVQSISGLHDKADEYFDLKNKAACEEDLKSGLTTILECDTFKWVSVTTEKGLAAEGKAMNHCVGSYWRKVDKDEITIYSLRDADNWPHLTVEVRHSNNRIGQCQGRSGETEKYDEYLKKFCKDQDLKMPIKRGTRNAPRGEAVVTREIKRVKIGKAYYGIETAKAKGNLHIWKKYKDGHKWGFYIDPIDVKYKQNVIKYYDGSRTGENVAENKENKFQHILFDKEDNAVLQVTGNNHDSLVVNSNGFEVVSSRHHDRYTVDNVHKKQIDDAKRFLSKFVDLFNAYGYTGYEHADKFPSIVKTKKGYFLKSDLKLEIPERIDKAFRYTVVWDNGKEQFMNNLNSTAFTFPTKYLLCKRSLFRGPFNEMKISEEIVGEESVRLDGLVGTDQVRVSAKTLIVGKSVCDGLEIHQCENIQFELCENVNIPAGEYKSVILTGCRYVTIHEDAHISTFISHNSNGPIETTAGFYCRMNWSDENDEWMYCNAGD